MVEGYSVELSSKSDILFPAECLMCGHDADGQERTIKIDPFNIDLVLSKRKKTVSIPMHRICSKKFGYAFWKRHGIILVSGTLSLVFYLYFYPPVKPFLKYFLWDVFFMLCFITLLSPFLLWWSRNPLPIECVHKQGVYIFTFTDRCYAESFAQLNKTAIKKGV